MERVSQLPGVSSFKGTNSIGSGSHPMTLFNLNYLLTGLTFKVGGGAWLGLSNVSLREKETQSRLQQGRTSHQREKLKATDTYYLTLRGQDSGVQLS